MQRKSEGVVVSADEMFQELNNSPYSMDFKFNRKWNLGSLNARFSSSRFVRRVVLSAACHPAYLGAGRLRSEVPYGAHMRERRLGLL
jgi:hypothetical protein